MENELTKVFFLSFLLELEVDVSQSPLARSPEVSGGSVLCMPNILCFKVCTLSHRMLAFVYIMLLFTNMSFTDERKTQEYFGLNQSPTVSGKTMRTLEFWHCILSKQLGNIALV